MSFVEEIDVALEALHSFVRETEAFAKNRIPADNLTIQEFREVGKVIDNVVSVAMEKDMEETVACNFKQIQTAYNAALEAKDCRNCSELFAQALKEAWISGTALAFIKRENEKRD